MKVIAVANPKGGCGKTTVCTNLACFLVKWEYNVVILDVDSQSSALDWSLVRSQNLYPITVIPTPADQLLDRLQNAQKTSVPKTVVLLDLPAAFSVEMELEMYPYLDAVLIPAIASPIDIRGMVRHVYDLYKHVFDDDEWPATGVIVNRAKVNTQIHKTVVEGFLQRISFPIISELRDTQNYPTAAYGGKGIVELPLRRVIKDLLQWKPIMEWITATLYPEESFSWDVVVGEEGKRKNG
jgi:chromosome partitioning protein